MAITVRDGALELNGTHSMGDGRIFLKTCRDGFFKKGLSNEPTFGLIHLAGQYTSKCHVRYVKYFTLERECVNLLAICLTLKQCVMRLIPLMLTQCGMRLILLLLTHCGLRLILPLRNEVDSLLLMCNAE